MRGLGIVAIIVGVIAVLASMAMNVSVSTGIGRVNNIGLMAQQQNFLIISALITFSGVVMLCLGGRRPAAEASSQGVSSGSTRPCPYCAEPIKHAAIRCKHCSADVDPMETPRLESGWVVSIACRPGLEFENTRAQVIAEGFDFAPSEGSVVKIGPYAQKDQALSVLKVLQAKHSLFGEIKHTG